jgi:hypothetical protein
VRLPYLLPVFVVQVGICVLFITAYRRATAFQPPRHAE